MSVSKLPIYWWGGGYNGIVEKNDPRVREWITQTGTVGINLNWAREAGASNGNQVANAAALMDETGAKLCITLSNGFLHNIGFTDMKVGEGFAADDYPDYGSKFFGYLSWFSRRLSWIRGILGKRAPSVFYLDCEMSKWGDKNGVDHKVTVPMYAALAAQVKANWPLCLTPFYGFKGITSTYKPKTDILTTVNQKRYLDGTEPGATLLDAGPVCYDVAEVVGPGGYLPITWGSKATVPCLSHIGNLGDSLTWNGKYLPTLDQLRGQLAVYVAGWGPAQLYLGQGPDNSAVTPAENDAAMATFVTALNEVVV